MRPPIKGVPTEVNRRLDELSRKTRRETIIKTIREIPVVGTSSTPEITVGENIDLGEWVATDSTIHLVATPAGEYMYEFAVQIMGLETWDVKLTVTNEATFSGLRPNTRYSCRVRSIALGGAPSLWSRTIVITTAQDTIAPPVPTGLSLVADSYYVRAKVDDILLSTVPDFDGFEWHASITSGFTPDSTTFRGSGRLNRLIFHVADAGLTWYVRVRSYDVNGNFSAYCSEVSVLIPVLRVPTMPTDPGTGELVVTGGTVEISDCDLVTDWESEAPNAIRLYASESVKEGTGALKIEIDKYGQRMYSTDYNSIIEIGSAPYMQCVGQRVKADGNFDLKRVSCTIWKYNSPPNPPNLYLYTDVSGMPGAFIAETTVSGVDTDPKRRHADFGTPQSLVDGTYYWIIWAAVYSAVGHYKIYFNSGDAYLGEECYMASGAAPLAMNKNPSDDMRFWTFSTEVSLNKYLKVKSAVLGTKDLSNSSTLEWWIQGSVVAGSSGLKLSMGEAGFDEQLHDMTVPILWTAKAWDITGISAGDRDAIAYFGIKVTTPQDDTATLYLDYFRGVAEKQVKIGFSDGPVIVYPADAVKLQTRVIDSTAPTDGQVLIWDQALGKWKPATLNVGEGHIVLFPWFRDSIGQGTWVLGAGSSYLYGGCLYNSSAANGDNFSWKATLAAGTYTLKLVVRHDTDGGILDIDIDGVEVMSVDTYAASQQMNQIAIDTGNVVASFGIKTIRLRVDGKHGSSTGYLARPSALILYRTA